MDELSNKPPHEKIKLTEVNPHLTCHLCKGYYIDATTIVECLHSFCRSCIIKFLQLNSYCPVCEVMINKAKPNIKPDKTLQDIVYKLVPGLYAMEMTRRRQFYRDRPDEAALVSPEQRGACTERIIFSPQDAISLSIEYTTDDQPEWYKNREATSEVPLRRYLQCPAMLRVEHLKKFICNKYNVDSQQFHVDILYKRVPLPDHYTLMDIAYIYSWKRNEPMKFFFRITDINLVTERFDYFEPSLSVEDDIKPPIHRSTPAKTKIQTKKEETVKVKTEIKGEENSSDTSLVMKNSDNKNSAKIENNEVTKVKIKEEKSDCEVNSQSSKDSISNSAQKSSEKIKTEKVPTFKNCLSEVKTPPTKELTIKTNNFTNILGCDPKTNSTLTNLQHKCPVPTLLKAVSPQKSPSKSKSKSPKKTDKNSKCSTETTPNNSKRDNLPQTVNHIPKSFENIFKPIKAEPKKSERKESFSKTLKSIHETIKNFPRSDTPPFGESVSDKPLHSPTSNDLLKPLAPILTIPIPKKETSNGTQKSPRSHHSPRSPKGHSKPEVLQKLNEQLKMTENLLTIVRNASKASEAKSEAKALANGLVSPKEHKHKKEKSPTPEIMQKLPTSPEDCGKMKFLESIQLTARSSLSPIKIGSPVKNTKLSPANPAEKIDSPETKKTAESQKSPKSPKKTPQATEVKKSTPESPKKVTSSQEWKKSPETKKSPENKKLETGVKRKLPRKDKPVKRIKLTPPKIKITPKPKTVQKILPKTTIVTNLTQSFNSSTAKILQNGVTGVYNAPQSSGLVQMTSTGLLPQSPVNHQLLRPPVAQSPMVANPTPSQPSLGMILPNSTSVAPLQNGVAPPKPQVIPKTLPQEVKNPNQLQSLFTNCNINIPSSLSITLTESPRSDDGYESKPNPIKPVQNYIEIVKLPETSPVPKNEKSNDSTNGEKSIKVEIKQEKIDSATNSKKLTFQTMFEEAIKKTDTKPEIPIQQIKVEPKSEIGTTSQTKKPAADLMKTPPKTEGSKRNILEIAHQLSKKSKLDLEGSIAKVAIPKTEPKEEKISIVNSQINSGGSISIQNAHNGQNKKALPQKLPIPRLPIQKVPTPKLGSANARAVPKPQPKVPLKPIKTPKSPINQLENIPHQQNISLTPNQILEKYNIQNLQQLSTNLTQAQLAFQQALIMSHQFEMQRLQASQKWLANPNVLAHYENYVQSMKQNQQNQICGNTNKN